MTAQAHESKGQAWSQRCAICRPSSRQTRPVIAAHKMAPRRHLWRLDHLSKVGTAVLILLPILFPRTDCDRGDGEPAARSASMPIIS
jgi:hypothetical protein